MKLNTAHSPRTQLIKVWDDPNSFADAPPPKSELARLGTLKWVTQDGDEMFIEHMRTSHLFNCVRMIFNHTVPERYRIEGGTYDMSRFPLRLRLKVTKAMLQELQYRDNLTPYHLRSLAHMRDTFKKIATLQLQ